VKLEKHAETWEIDDAEARHRSAPDLHSIPPLVERCDVRIGERVQLLFLFQGSDEHGPFIQSEHLWVHCSQCLIFWLCWHSGRCSCELYGPPKRRFSVIPTATYSVDLLEARRAIRERMINSLSTERPTSQCSEQPGLGAPS